MTPPHTYPKPKTAADPIPRTPLRFFWFVSKPSRPFVIGAVLIVIIAAAISQSTSYFFKLITDAASAGRTSEVVLYGILFPVAVAVAQLLYRLSGVLARIWVTNAAKYSYDKLSEHILFHSHTYFSDRFSGSILSKMNNSVNAVQTVIPDILWTHLSATVSFLITLVIMLTVNIPTALTFVGLIVVLFVVNSYFAPRKAALSNTNAAAQTALRGGIVDAVSNVQAIRQYSRYQNESSRIDELSSTLREAHSKNWGYTEWMLFWNTLILFASSLLMFWFLVNAWQSGQITTGDFILIMALYSQIIGILLFIGRAFNNTAQAFGELREGLDDLLIPYEITDTPGAAPLQLEAGRIEWQQVSFRFGENQVFQDFDLSIEPGQRVGLVGSSGAGKTTFVSLLLRQHDITHGVIMIDGQDIAAVKQDSLRQNVAVVPQEPLLFHRSIQENIAYGNPDASEEEIIAVAKKAQALDFIESLPEGFATLVGERGVKLSGGQKQRVAIARAMLKDAPILVLDEATSALDSESEVLIQQALHELMAGKTVIAIAHRLSTLREMDRVLVLDQGQIVEDGSHDSLKRGGGTYQRLWEHQAGGFLQE